MVLIPSIACSAQPSMKTILPGSNRFCHDLQRRRWRAILSLVCSRAPKVFLKRSPSRRRKRQIASCETVTPRAASSAFSPCRVRCGSCPIRSARKRAVRLQHPLAMAAHPARRHRARRPLPLRPLHHRRHRHPKPRRHRAAAPASSHRRNHALAQIVRQSSDHPMPASIPASILNHNLEPAGIPNRFRQPLNRSN